MYVKYVILLFSENKNKKVKVTIISIKKISTLEKKNKSCYGLLLSLALLILSFCKILISDCSQYAVYFEDSYLLLLLIAKQLI